MTAGLAGCDLVGGEDGDAAVGAAGLRRGRVGDDRVGRGVGFVWLVGVVGDDDDLAVGGRDEADFVPFALGCASGVRRDARGHAVILPFRRRGAPLFRR
jgi:hypothetical protein